VSKQTQLRQCDAEKAFDRPSDWRERVVGTPNRTLAVNRTRAQRIATVGVVVLGHHGE
jgi:hypothetical protein